MAQSRMEPDGKPQPQRRNRGIGGGGEVETTGLDWHPFRDAYHFLIEANWRFVLGVFGGLYLSVNAVFAALYAWVGGISGMRPGSFEDAFYFSVQTFGTIGYGAMAPATRAAHILVTLESMVGILLLAMVTGIVFAKFSRPGARVRFSDQAVITPMDGVPTLMFRAANEPGSYVVQANMTVWLVRPQVTSEGQSFFRTYELKLERDRSPIFNRTWTVLHRIEAQSPLYGATPEAMKDWEIVAMMVGADPSSGQSIHASQSYYDEEIRFGMRHADMLTVLPGDRYRVDFARFDELIETTSTESFPYPRKDSL